MNERGFTLVELLVTVAVIGLLASIATNQYSVYKKQAKITAAYQELSMLRTAFIAYTVDNEELPTDTTQGQVPTGMENFIPSGLFSNPTPIGGLYNWDGPPNHDPPGISIQGPTVPASDLLALDRRIDDGNLSTGEFRITGGDHYMLRVRN